MAHNNNKALQPTLLAVAVSTVLFGAALPAAAQQQAAAAKDKETAALEVIQVTARRTAENLQTVPVAVTSIGAEDLKQKGIENITSVQQYSPNTTLQVSRGTNSTLTAYIRGIGQQDPLWGFEPGVGIYIDDVYMARPQGAALDIYDVERIEVLRGPQGTLYGRNTIGGAVKYVTKALSGDNEFAVRGTLGSYGQQDLKLSGQTAITDKLFIGADGFDVEQGITTFNEAYQVSQAMCQSAKKIIVVTDSCKFGQRTPNVVVPIDKIDIIITDPGISDADRQALERQGIEILLV